MKYMVSNRVKEIANIASKIPGVKSLLKPLYYRYKKSVEKKRNVNFRNNALSVLADFDKALSVGGFQYTLAFGTLLGAVREKGFIKHDLDIDVAMWADEWSLELRNCLSNAGFHLWHTFEVDGGAYGREETYEKDNVAIDIFFFYPAIDQHPYCCDFLPRPSAPTHQKCMELYGGSLPRRVELPMKRERIKTQFETLELYIPENAHEILTFRYGESYMVPNPQWGIRSHDTHIVECPEKLGVYKEYSL